eukprot:663472-Pyramimonas_sp.AAC.1
MPRAALSAPHSEMPLVPMRTWAVVEPDGPCELGHVSSLSFRAVSSGPRGYLVMLKVRGPLLNPHCP